MILEHLLDINKINTWTEKAKSPVITFSKAIIFYEKRKKKIQPVDIYQPVAD